MTADSRTPEGRGGSRPTGPRVIAVLCADAHDHAARPGHLQPLEGLLDWRFADADGLAEAVREADALLLWDFFSSAVADVWEQAQHVEWIHVAAAGVDKLLFEELAASDVVVTNARGIFDRPIAEFVAASVFAHAKRVHETHDLQVRRQWLHRETATLVGKRALIVGTGAIGREIARLLRALGLQVRGAGSRARAGDPDFGDVIDSARLAEHVTQLREVDYLVNAAPLTQATRGLIDAGVLAALKPGAHLVNIGRGPTVVEADLLAAVRDGRLDGASLDVFETEPLPSESALWDAPGVVVSPHMSGDVVGWRDALARQFVDNAQRWLAGEELSNIVDKRLGYVPAG
ncbi:MAG: D-2-hydroxyacid dehydrogenase [Micrococcales bacterium]|nr:D-2-hydroxyacid dehydrogenase [Micrococcales bacterium]